MEPEYGVNSRGRKKEGSKDRSPQAPRLHYALKRSLTKNQIHLIIDHDNNNNNIHSNFISLQPIFHKIT